MGRLILCNIKKAKKPYFIKNMNINIYTIEELCYYLYHNIYLIDDNVINDALIQWIDEELELTDLTEILNKNRGSMKNFMMTILNYAGFISNEDMEETDKLLSEMDGQSGFEKKVARADHLLHCGKYVEAISEYQTILMQEDEKLSEKILNNLGVAYARMFLFHEAAKYFKKAYDINHNEEIYKHLLFAVAMAAKGEIDDSIKQDIKEDYDKILEEEIDQIVTSGTNKKLMQFQEVLNYKKENQIAMYYKSLEGLLQDWKKEYLNLT